MHILLYTESTSTPTIEQLKDYTGVRDAQLDMEFQYENVVALASHFGNPTKLIGRLPGLSEAVFQDVMNKAHCDTEAAVILALKTWRELNPMKATFRALVEIALDMRNGDLARKICKYVLKVFCITCIHACIH